MRNAPLPPPQPGENPGECSSQNVDANVERGGALAEGIAELRRDGIEVDNNNGRAPANADEPPVEPDRFVHNFTKPLFCARRALTLQIWLENGCIVNETSWSRCWSRKYFKW